MSTEILGVIRADGDRRAVRFEWHYGTDQADLWEALTEPERLARWFATVRGDLSEGGSFEILFDDEDPDQRAAGSILECRPPDHLRISWLFGDEVYSEVTADLAAEEDGTRLVLEHSGLPNSSAAGYGAGWETYLEQLQADLGGGTGLGLAWDQRWAQLKPAYDAILW
jgi:uncharacterized protein YndB with AHSA1/START domain